jgi:hypothetical protein
MLTRTTARRTAPVLLAALVAGLLVTLGAPARAATPRVAAGTTEAALSAQTVRAALTDEPAVPQQDPVHLDLVAAPHSVDVLLARATPPGAPDQVHTRTSRKQVTPTGRAPPGR